MKFIITEHQEAALKILRRLDEDWPLLRDIVDEGVDIDDPCDFRDVDSFLRRIVTDSAHTYLLHYYDDIRGEKFAEMLIFIGNLIKERLGEEIIEYYNEKKEDCEQF